MSKVIGVQTMGGVPFTRECYLRDGEDLNMQGRAEGTVWAEAQSTLFLLCARTKEPGRNSFGGATGSSVRMAK